MNSCSSTYCHGGHCTCGMFYNQNNSNTTSAYSMLYNQYQTTPFEENYSDQNTYSFASSTSSNSVDCTLSLGTPSTRLSTSNDNNEKRLQSNERRSNSYMSKCWNILQPKNHKSSRGSSNGNTNSGGADPLVARRCANCDTTSTPLWRNGPRGPKSLCNACGIRFKKEERRASAAAATANGGGMDHTQHMINGGSWVHHSQAQKMPCYSSAAYGNHEFRFIEDDDRDSDNSIPFWPFMASQRC
ncbi:GATA transcription factor 19-like [Nicotiana tabacum]|uniref:GATA transcription factor 18-like n=1 Tax=Nicotiana tabacum TaxID=4097 RepID=A0A1S4D5Y8_TOBAC|nr:PREDICTED: GATA transcription factor 18-like [Nicotiana tabacum]